MPLLGALTASLGLFGAAKRRKKED
nr:LPXTG cell wall anchor domain-containing protein [Streptococcus himalayensis]